MLPLATEIQKSTIIGKDDSTVRYVGTVRYTSIFLRSTIRWYGRLFYNGTGTVRWYGTSFFVMVRIRYVGTLFEFKIPDFLQVAVDFCM